MPLPPFVPQVLRLLQHGALAAVASGFDSNWVGWRPPDEGGNQSHSGFDSNWVEGAGAADAQHRASPLLAVVRRSGGRMDASTLALLVSASLLTSLMTSLMTSLITSLMTSRMTSRLAGRRLGGGCGR